MRHTDLTGEFDLIDRIRKTLGHPSSRTTRGIGDDAAVLRPGAGKLLATVDMLVENVHFDFAYSTFAELGHRALAVNLSDIAAMGGRARFALVSLALPRKYYREAFVREFYSGMKRLARRHGVDIVGGNLTKIKGPLVVDVTCLGESAKPILRSGAKVGDAVMVTGALGSAAAGLFALKKLGVRAKTPFPKLTRAQLTPTPRLATAGRLARSRKVTSLIDISDGLSNEVNHLARQSGVGVVIDERQIPLLAETRRCAERYGKDPVTWALHGGEDYELLFTVDKKWVKSFPGCRPIGEIRPDGEGVTLVDGRGRRGPLVPRGWDHFRLDPA